MVIAYFCRMYAVEKGVEIRKTDPAATDAFLIALMDGLDAAKKKLPPAKVDKASGKATMTAFALSVFAKADAQEQAGSPDPMATARTFNAAALFLDTLRQFGEEDVAFANRRKYAKAMCVQIMQVIKEGGTVVPSAGFAAAFEATEAAAGGGGGGGGGGAAEDGGFPAAPPSAQVPPPVPAAAPSPLLAPSPPVSPQSYGGGSDGGPAMPPQAGYPATAPPPAVAPAAAPPGPATGTAFNPGYTPPLAVGGLGSDSQPYNPSGAARAYTPAHNAFPAGTFVGDPAKFDDAIEWAKYAIRHLEFRDANAAAQFLENALATIKKP